MPEPLSLSLVTLPTLGYGDILRVMPPARMLAAIEAIIGPLDSAVLIARLSASRLRDRAPAAEREALGPVIGRVWSAGAT